MKPLPRLRFAHLPTVVEPMTRLSALLKGPRLLVKRDDQTGLALGGNKARKLEFLVADAQTNNAQTLITAGAVQSNHCRQTAAAAARYGFDCILVLSGRIPKATSGNLLLDQLFGAELIYSSREGRDDVLQQAYQNAQDAGKKPYLIPYGGSNPIGAVGYVFAMNELLNQFFEHGALSQPPDWIVFPSSSGGTQAGLVLGANLFGYTGKILGISVDEPEQVLQGRVANLVEKTANYLGEVVAIRPDDVYVNANYLGGGYGVRGEPEKEAIQLFGKYEGLLIDPVYTGRAAAGLIDLIRQDFFNKNETVLFLHTGGTPALFANDYS